LALKTTGMAALAAQSGIPVAAQRAVLPLFDRVLVDIGDEQSIAADCHVLGAYVELEDHAGGGDAELSRAGG